MPARSRLLFLAALSVVSLLAGSGPAAAVADPRLPEQWGLAVVGAPAAWSVGTGAGVTIAVIDTGVDFAHEDLRTKLLPGRNVLDAGKPPQDDQGHGSHVAGIAAAATGNGLGVAGTAPGASILPVKVLDSGGSGSVDNIAEGIRWAAGNGAQVINLSLGPNAVLATLLGSGLDEAVNEAWGKGAVVVIAAGNDFLFSSSYSTVNAIVVTATTRDDHVAGYASGVGSAKWGLAAPGGAGGGNKADDILSTHWKPGKANAYEHLAGTSMATPYVAGAAAVLRSLGHSPQQTVDRLLATAKDLGRAGRDSTYGAGRVDLAAAVGAVSTSGVPPATPPAATATPSTPAGGPAPTAPRSNPAAPTSRTRSPATTVPATAPPTTAPPLPPGAPVADTTVPEPVPTEAAAPVAAKERRARARPTAGDDRPWGALGGAGLALAGAGAASVWVPRRLRRA